MEPPPPPVQLGDVTEEELKAYEGTHPTKPLLMAIKGLRCYLFQVCHASASIICFPFLLILKFPLSHIHRKHCFFEVFRRASRNLTLASSSTGDFSLTLCQRSSHNVYWDCLLPLALVSFFCHPNLSKTEDN
ncbi:hypothetical protein O6H91_01G001600 [Diphasiastrum complanatum]|uniref:Uncharacterized protein n=1 Tax=Diphasiastrum complanatum TaxID=34168 RepID=A0ACC2EMD1_DIPCM|nr:hypothetical protein O6H91_01G001600 [Diphasiastrum complanatum]